MFRGAFPLPRTTLAQAAAVLDLSEPEIRRRWLGDLPEPEGGFTLQARARHQLTELARVEQGRDCLLAKDAAAFGALMDASHASCANDYGVSSPQLDKLVEVARECGSIGSRLTGAGFGGCTVNLVPNNLANDFADQVSQRYYRDYLGRDDGDPVRADWILNAHPVRAADYVDL